MTLDFEGPCRIWKGTISSEGYGRIGHKYAHRVTYETEVGPIPEGLELDHLCRNRACVNPAHLEPVTRAENLRRSPLVAAHTERLAEISRSKTECPQGHPYDDENTYRNNGSRFCRACRRERARVARLEA